MVAMSQNEAEQFFRAAAGQAEAAGASPETIKAAFDAVGKEGPVSQQAVVEIAVGNAVATPYSSSLPTAVALAGDGVEAPKGGTKDAKTLSGISEATVNKGESGPDTGTGQGPNKAERVNPEQGGMRDQSGEIPIAAARTALPEKQVGQKTTAKKTTARKTTTTR